MTDLLQLITDRMANVSILAAVLKDAALLVGAAIGIAPFPVRRHCPFRGRRPFRNARRRHASKRMERRTEQFVHVSTPFGRIMLGRSESSEFPKVMPRMLTEPLPESTRSLPQDPIDDRLASV